MKESEQEKVKRKECKSKKSAGRGLTQIFRILIWYLPLRRGEEPGNRRLEKRKVRR
jgi:hypothetical protein